MTTPLVLELYPEGAYVEVIETSGTVLELQTGSSSAVELFDVSAGPVLVEVVVQGPQGPPGSGTSLSRYEHIQSVASSTWGPVVHNLGRYVDTAVFIGGQQVYSAEVIHQDLNTTYIYFSSPQVGRVLFT